MIKHSKPTLSLNELASLKRVLKSANLARNGTVKELESNFAKFIGKRFSLATNSGTSALHLSLLSLNLSRGEEIIIPSFVCTALLNAINYAGAKPVICDIDRYNFNLDFIQVKKHITKRTKAIILPHMFGLPAGVDESLKLNIPIIEDCAQVVGASFKGRKIGSFGLISMFSFYATKVITTGQGGMLLTNSAKIFNQAKDLIEDVERDDYKLRYNYNMTDIQAALGLAQLKRINTFIRRRKEIAQYYNQMFYKYDIITPLDLPEHIYYRYIIRIKTPIEKFIKRLKEKGIEAKLPVFKPLHRYLGLEKRLFPATEEVYKSAVSLPIYPSLTEEEVRLIVEVVLNSL
jgi:perosamine synthetase